MHRQAEAGWWRPDVVARYGERAERPVEPASDAAGSPVPFQAMMVFTFIMLFAPQSYFPALAPFRIGLLTAIVAVLAYLIDRLRRGLPIMMRTREMWFAVCLAAWAAVTAPFSYWPGGSVEVLLGQYFKTLAIFWLLSHTVTAPVRFRQVAWGLSIMAIGLGVTAVDNYFSDTAPIQGGDYAPSRMFGNESTLKNPNDLALMLNLILPLNVALLLVSRTIPARSFLLASVLLSMTAIVLTYSRAGFLTLATTFTLYLWKLRNRPERVWTRAILVVALACLPLLPASYVDRLSTIVKINADQTGSAQERLRDTLAAINHAFTNPVVGAGLGMNVLALNEVRGATWTSVHNVYLEYAMDLGLPGLALFLLLLTGCVKNTMLVQERSAGIPARRDLFSFAEGLQISLIAFAVAGLFHPVAYHFYFYYIAGLAVAIKAAHEIESRRA
jgi:probable O-glycosylation ligase (exosortase A-associated)